MRLHRLAGGSTNDETKKRGCLLGCDFFDGSVCGCGFFGAESGSSSETSGESVTRRRRRSASGEEDFQKRVCGVPWRGGGGQRQTAHAAAGIGDGSGGEPGDIVLDFEKWVGEPPDAFVFAFAGGATVADYPVSAETVIKREGRVTCDKLQ